MRRRTFLKLSAAAGAGVAAGCKGTYELLPGMSRRGWDRHAESMQTSFCTLCPARCGLRVRVVDGKARSVAGLPDHPTNRGGLCPLGAAALQLRLHPHRVVHPLHRAGPGDTFQRSTWPAARSALAAALRASGGSAVVLVNETAATTRIALWRRLMGEVGGEVVLWSAGHLAESWSTVARWTMGVDRPPVADWSRADLVVTVGLNALATGPSPVWAQQVFGRSRGRLRWIHVGPRLDNTAARADLWLPCLPGTEAWVLLGLAYVVLKRQAYDAGFLEAHARGWEELAGQILNELDIRRVSGITGVPEDHLIKAGVIVAAARRPVCVPGEEALWTRHGHLAGWAAIVLNAVKGSVATPGGLVVRGPLPLEEIPGPSAPLTSLGLWLRKVASGRFSPAKLLVLDGVNPLFAFSDSSPVGRWFDAAGERFAFGLLADESARRCHWLLPSTLHLEDWGDAAQPPGVPYDAYLVRAPAVPPRGEARPVEDTLLAVANGLGIELPAPSFHEIIARRARGLAHLRRGAPLGDLGRLEQVAAMEERGWWFGQGPATGLDRLADLGGWADLNTGAPNWSSCVRTPDGRLDLLPEAIGEAHLRPPQRTESPVIAPHFEITRDPNLTLPVPWTLRVAGLTEGQVREAWAAINPETAAALGIHQGDPVTLRVPGESGHEIHAQAVVTPGVVPGVVAVPFGFGHSEGPSFYGPQDTRPLGHLIPMELHPALPTRIVGSVPVEVTRG